MVDHWDVNIQLGPANQLPNQPPLFQRLINIYFAMFDNFYGGFDSNIMNAVAFFVDINI